ncbi:MAG: hypothetical protein VKJ27_00050 [Synechocystis sp.]|nr:hypothetical protein [Synechocystis sp.]
MRQSLAQFSRKVLLPLGLSGWMVSCSPLNPWGWAQDYLDIAKLNEISNQRTVNLQGIVVNVAPFLEGGAYQIQDKTGKVWVKTDGELPKKGTVVTIKGEVAYEAIFIGPEKLGESYIIEITAPQPQETAASTGTPSAVPRDQSPSAPGNATVTESPVIEAVDTTTEATGTTAIAVVDSQPPETPASEGNSVETVETVDTDTPDNGAAALMPTTPDNPPQATNLSVTNPTAERPIVTPPSPPVKPRLSVDDQFLPHKRLAK